MNMAYAPVNFQQDPIDAALAQGLKDLWFPVCPSHFVKEQPVSLRRLGYKIVLWRDGQGQVQGRFVEGGGRCWVVLFMMWL